MALTAGTRLGAYEIATLIGVGGMGEVYRARDHKLDRDVAIKVLPDSVATDPERLSRFEREAKTLAALNQQNIAQIYGVEDSTGTPALIMELVEGPTLADRIAKGPVPLHEALPIAAQIAEGLEAAHEQGIIHRDLKPANIKVRLDGTVKVLDFGLAKALEPVGAMAVGISMSPTITTPAMTQAGMILGTAAYMSPEQARGKVADRRADIWAFGCVLFEMLTGRTPFEIGETVSDTIASILKTVPEWSALPVDTPPRIVTLLRRCLQKDPQRRLPHIGLVRMELNEDGDVVPASTATISQVARPPRAQRVVPIVITAAAASILTAVALMWRATPMPPAEVTRFAMMLPEGQQFSNTGRRAVAISPDGRRVAYVANRQLYVRDLSLRESRLVRGTDNIGAIFSPAFSPDGQELAFATDNARTIKRVGVDGGVPATVARLDLGVASIVWESSGIVFAHASAIGRVSPTGGDQETLFRARAGEMIQSGQLLPGGRALLMALIQPARDGGREMSSSIVVETLASHERRILREPGTDPIYVRTGHVLYALGGTIYAMPFDAARSTVGPGPIAVIEGVRRGEINNLAQFAVSTSGTLVYIPGVAGATTDASQLGIFDPDGRLVQRLTMPLAQYDGPRVSPDGTRLAVGTDDGIDATVWTYDLSAAKAPQRLTFEGKSRYPTWSSDGLRLAFQSDRGGDKGIFWQRADGTGPIERLTTADRDVAHIPTAFSPRDDVLLYVATTDKTATLWTLSLRDKSTARFDAVDSFMASMAAWSPDGKWIVYSTEDNSAGNLALIVQPFPATGEKREITRNRGRFPTWSRDGRELFYFVGPNQMEKVDVSAPPFAVSTGMPVQAVSSMLLHRTRVRPFDIMPDGKRFVGFVGATETGNATTPHLEVVLNWSEELKARVPTK